MLRAEVVRDALDEFMPCYGSEESAKRKREVLDAFDGIVARVAELEAGVKAAILEIEGAHYGDAHNTLANL